MRQPLLKIVQCLLCGFTLLFGVPDRAWAGTYSIKGRFQFDPQLSEHDRERLEHAAKILLEKHPELKNILKLPLDQNMLGPLTRDFTVETDEENNWKVTVRLLENRDFSSLVAQYDGRNLVSYCVTSDSTNLDVACIHQGVVPQAHTSAFREIPWLAFASGRYFHTLGNSEAQWFEISRSTEGVVRRLQIPVAFQLLTGPPYLPSYVSFGTKAGGIPTAGPAANLAPANVHAEYKAHAFTNLGGARFPLSFEYERQHFVGAHGKTNGRCHFTISGVASEFSFSDRPIDFELPTRIAVADQRVSSPISPYVITNSHLPATNSSIVRVAQERAAKRIRNQKLYSGQGGSPRDRFVFYAVGFVVFFAVPAYFVYKRARPAKC